jgi:hypothetical protein
VPVQTAPIHSLLEKVNELGKIFLNCLKETDDEASKQSAELARKVASTYEIVEEAIEDLLNENINKNFIEDALN